ncbi:MAG: hypothetical protein AAGF90_13570, partial [Pseudomonadota bacterium]
MMQVALDPQTRKAKTLAAFEPEVIAEIPTSIAAKGATLTGRWREPSGRAAAVAVVHPAAGVPQSYYAAFAGWLARERSVAVLTYDYRDFGASLARPIREAKATMGDWGAMDQAAALAAARRRAEAEPGGAAPLWAIGHSLGGMMTGFHPDAAAVDRLIAVASGPVHWRDHPASYMPQVFAFWAAAGPASTAALGYLPGRALGLGADLPRGVYWQWRRWCLTPGFWRVDEAAGRLPPNDRAA